MRIYFTLDNNNRVSSYSTSPMDCEDDIQYEIDTDIEFDKLGKCDFINNHLVLNNDYEIEDVRRRYRIKRERECFSIINRGQLWYEMLTADQRNDLKIWYKAWLDVTETLEMPNKPSWL